MLASNLVLSTSGSHGVQQVVVDRRVDDDASTSVARARELSAGGATP